jgi:hypothetical protein
LAHPVETRDIDTLVRELWKAARAAAETGRASLKKSLEELNSDTMAGHGIAGGLSMAEAISKQFADNSYTNHDSPRIIFYSSSNGGGVVASQCARIARIASMSCFKISLAPLKKFAGKNSSS